MLSKVYRGQGCICRPGDVLFAVFKPNTSYREPLPYEHAAIFSARKSVSIMTPADRVQVLEVREHPSRGTWPSGDYEVQLAGEKRNEDQSPLSSEIRAQIIMTARRIVRRTVTLHDNYGSYRHCDWELRRYKYVRPNPNDPGVADELHFTCAGFAEYCYEQAGQDIINDPPCFRDHDRDDCSLSAVPLYRNRRKNELIHRLYPGYLIKAFDDDLYPLDFKELQRRGEYPRDFQRYSSSHLDQ